MILSDDQGHAFMDHALRVARRASRVNEVPVGAVIVRNGRVVCAMHNLVRRFQTPLAHAEILVILMAQKRLNTPYLDDCLLYVTLQPCPMCAHAIALARLKRVYFGAYALKKCGIVPETVGGVCEHQCSQLLDHFFCEKRWI